MEGNKTKYRSNGLIYMVRRRLLPVIAVIAMLIAVAPGAQASTRAQRVSKTIEIEQDEINQSLLTTLANYTAWNSVMMDGTLTYPGLPVNPSVRLYMRRDSLVTLSVRAPLLGEVLRADISKSKITIINRMKKTYCDESMDNLVAMYPGIIADVQSILLGRIVIFGQGELDVMNASALDIRGYEAEEDGYLYLPAGGDGMFKFDYDYNVRPDGKTTALNVNIEVKENKIDATITYGYDNGIAINALLTAGGKREQATLRFKKPVWGAAGLSPATIGNGYRRVGVAEVMKF